MNIIADASLPLLSKLFPPPFNLSFYHSANEAKQKLRENQVLLCRSTLKIDGDFLQNNAIECIATASSGVDHIDVNTLKQRGIHLFDAKGSNATSVADYVLSILAWLSHNKIDIGSVAGIIGMGYVGKAVYRVLKMLHYDVICYDPLLEELNTEFKQLFECNLLCIHPNLHNMPPFPSRNLIDSRFLKQLRPNSILLNASRGGVVVESALLENKIPLYYCTDVYESEPNISKEIVDLATLCTPHIAGHSTEAKNRAVIAVSQQIHSYYGIPFSLSSRQGLADKLWNVENKNWQEEILARYNPFLETNALKASNNITETFLQLRGAHFRHDFNLETIKNDKFS